MDRRRRESSSACRDLLNKQLANITETLAKASQRRDEAVKKSSRVRRAPTTAKDIVSSFESAASVVEGATKCAFPGSTPVQLDGEPGELDVAALVDASKERVESREKESMKLSSLIADLEVDNVNLEGREHHAVQQPPSVTEESPKALLAELRNLRSTTHVTGCHDKNDIRCMLANPKGQTTVSNATTTDYDNNPQSMLEELAMLSAAEPSKAMSYAKDITDDTVNEDLNILRAKLHSLYSTADTTLQLAPGSDKKIGQTEQSSAETIAATLPDPETIPYIIALALEHSNTPWQRVQAWTNYLFSSGPETYNAERDKNLAVAHAEHTLNTIIGSTMDDERIARETKSQRRLIVSNIAASADLEEMERQFWNHRSQIRDITFLPDRDPLKRTQTAHVDMASRKAAVQASHLTGHVYGLIFDVRLAVERQKGE